VNLGKLHIFMVSALLSLAGPRSGENPKERGVVVRCWWLRHFLSLIFNKVKRFTLKKDQSLCTIVFIDTIRLKVWRF